MIKNVIFDVDGVLVDINRCYIEFLKNTYAKFSNIKPDDLPVLFPIDPNDGAIKLSAEFTRDFRHSPYYLYRPLFDDTKNVLQSLKENGFRLFTLSAASNPARKYKWVSKEFGNIFDAYEFSPSGQSKAAALQDLLEKHSLDKTETIFIDDRLQHIRAAIMVGCHTIRREPQYSLPLHHDLAHVNVVKSMTEIADFIYAFNKGTNN